MIDSWIPVESTNLKLVRYHPEREELDIVFHNRESSFYRYEGVGEKHFNYLVAKSGKDLGWYFYRVFRNSFPCTRIDFDAESKMPGILGEDTPGNG